MSLVVSASAQRIFYVGTIGANPVQMNLHLTGKTVEGSYLIPAQGTMKTLDEGVLGADGTLVIQELAGNPLRTDLRGDQQAATISGKFDKSFHGFSGVWKTADGKRALPIHLREAADYAEGEKTYSPHWSFSFVQPRFPQPIPALQTLMTQLSRDVQAQRRIVIQSAKDRTAHPDLFGNPTADYQLDYVSEIIYQSKGWISINTRISQYNGGAHGSTAYLPATYWWPRGTLRRVTLADIFTPGTNALAELTPLIRRELRRQQAQWVPTRLKKSDLTAFYLTPDGITFIFGEYAVSPYSDGPFYVYIPRAALGHTLNPLGPLGSEI